MDEKCRVWCKIKVLIGRFRWDVRGLDLNKKLEMEGLNRKCEIDLNGKYKGRMENTRVEWKI